MNQYKVNEILLDYRMLSLVLFNNQMRQAKSQKIIMFSKDISTLANYTSSKHLLPIIEQDLIYPRVFPVANIPLKVALARKIKIFQDFDLNATLKNVQWKYGRGMLDLMYYNFEVDIHLQQCTQQKMANHIVKARAYEIATKQFKEFTVLEVKKINNQVILRGFFKEDETNQTEIPKFYVCFHFENPQRYVEMIQKAVRNREEFLKFAKYNFYIENIDLEGAPEIPKDLLVNITKKMNIQFMDLQNYKQLNNFFKRTMNEILFTNTLQNDPHLVEHSIEKMEIKKAASFKPKNRVIKLMKDNKMFKLVLKSIKSKIEDLQTKNLFFKEQIVHLMRTCKQKAFQISKFHIFDLKQETVAVQRFTSDNMLMAGYFTHFIEEEVIYKIAADIRKELLASPDGWFKVYNTDRNTYLMSKLRRLFILIEQNIKTVLKEHINFEIKRYTAVFMKRKPSSINFSSLKEFTLKYVHSNINQVQYVPLLIVNLQISSEVIVLGISPTRIEEMLIKNINKVLQKVQKIDTPQNKALIEIFAMYKNQYGIEVQIPKIGEPQTQNSLLDRNTAFQQKSAVKTYRVNNLQYDWIQQQVKQLFKLIKQLTSSLAVIENHLVQVNKTLDTKRNSKNINTSKNLKVKDIIEELSHYKSLNDKIDDILPGTGVNFGLFHIDYKVVKDQIKDLIDINIGTYKNLLIKEYQYYSLKLESQLIKMMKELEEKPQDIYELVKQRQRLQNLQSIVAEFNQKNQLQLYDVCEAQLCMLSKNDQERRWLNTGKITALFQKRVEKQKEYKEIKKKITDVIEKQLEQIKDSIGLFDVTLSLIKYQWQRIHYIQNYSKLCYLQKQYETLKHQIQDVRYKETHLSLPQNDFSQFETIEQDFLVLYTYWESIERWQNNKKIWYLDQLSNFQLDKPEIILSEILSNIKKIDKSLKQNYIPQLSTQILQIKKQIQIFQDNHLKLLKILKKDGFNKKHLQKIGIFIKGDILDLNLQWAIDNCFLDKIDQIQAVSNDAWNEFYLEQTLDRVFLQLTQMKYDIIFYLDKKNNQIPLVNNYQSLNQKLETIILDLESMQFNPMKGQYQKRINDLVQKSIYISKSLQSCEIFQKKLIELHPIFDSTDVVKQLSVQNKLFTKILRNWIELVNYMKKIISVYDSCNGQNIYQKVTSMFNNIEKIKFGLANYLQKKRQGFNRFYLLTDQELYQLFASTNDMKVLSKHINKLFHSVNQIIFDQQYINSVQGNCNILNLQFKVLYRRVNLEDWLTTLENSLKNTIRYHIQSLIKIKKNWTKLLSYQCSQAILLCYQLQKTFQLEQTQNFKKTMDRERGMIRKLVEIKKTQQLTQAQIINLSSLLVLALYFSDKLNFFITNNITDLDHFQLKKMLKIYYKEQQVKIRSFETDIDYGYEYLGLIKRLVLTNLTERMQLIYMSAIKYSLGGAAIGPAGTGKSQTTKDIARICGKTCLIYNCSEALNIEIVAKILKGMVVTGLWVCFDQFNRLNYQVLNILSEQLSIIFKYKAIGMKLEVQYEREVINFKPDFHLCITYNPTYLGRQKIPKNVIKHFRTVAMVICDKKMICQLLFYTKGFKSAHQLSDKLNKVFQYCQQLWFSFSLYDFGLRSLISIIELAGLLYKGQSNGELEVIEAIRILVIPRVTQHHRQIMNKYIKVIFGSQIVRQKKQGFEGQAENLKSILQVRIGIIMLGDVFSGKTTTLSFFENNYQDYKIQHIQINTLSVSEIYGETNPTTRIFRDGYLTKKIREFINSPKNKKMLIAIEGVIFSEWIQNLNSVLDNSRSLSLPSGQILNIPQKIKFLINCMHLQFASPATISRSCIIRFRQKKKQEILIVQKQFQKIKNKVLQSYEEFIQLIKPNLLYKLDQKLVLHWINKYFAKCKFQFSLESFWHIFSFILEGSLTEVGKSILFEYTRKKLGFEYKLFDVYWDGKNWKKIKQMPSMIVNDDLQKIQHVTQVVVKQQKYKKIQYLNKLFLSKNSGNDLMLLLGPPNSGKSSIIQQIFRLIDHSKYTFNKVNLTRKIKRDRLYTSIESGLHKKTNKRKGMLQGREYVVFLDDLNLPEANQFKYKQVVSFLSLLLKRKGCYNYNILQFQFIEDLFLTASCNNKAFQLNFPKDFLKFTLPYFVCPYQKPQIQLIFSSIIDKNTNITQYKKQYLQCSKSLLLLIQQIEDVSKGALPKYMSLQFVNYRNILNNILQWDITKLPNTEEGVVRDIFIYETERIIVNRFSQPQTIKRCSNVIKECFRKDIQSTVLFHSFQQTVNGTVLEPKSCQQVIDFNQFLREVECICDEYVLSSDKPNQGLVVFPQLCVRLCYISRCLSLKKMNISIIGLPKCGKKILVQLCNYLIRGHIYKISNTYEQKNWYQTIRGAAKQSYSNKWCSILLLQHYQIKEIVQKEQLYILLKEAYLPAVFSQADFQQLVYLFQNQLIRNRVAVNKENTIHYFVNYLKSNFKIVLLFNPKMKEFKEDLINYPSITKYSQFNWITEWPTQALLMIANQTIVQNELDTHISIFPKIHEICKQITKQKTNIPHWEGLYLDYLKTFATLYDQNKKNLLNKINKLEKSFNIIKQTQLKLQTTRDEIKRLQPTILLLEKETVKTIKSLNIQKANAESANEQLMKKEAECSKIIAQANVVKKKLQRSNTIVQEQLKKAWENVYLVKQNHIAQIKALMNPSQLIKIVITAIIVVLNEGDIDIIKNRSEDGLAIQQNYFETGKRFILSKDSKQITRLLTEYKKEKLTKQKIFLLEEKCLNHPRWNITEAKSANKAIYYFFIWVEAVVKYFKLYQETTPMRSELQKTTVLVDQKNYQIDIIKKQLSIYDNKIRDLTEAHQDKTLKLHQYSNQIKLFQKMLNRGYQILKEIQSEKSKWQMYKNFILEKQKLNFGNTILSSSLIIYNSPHSQETRQIIMGEIKNILQQHTVQFNNDDIFWLLENEEEIILKQLGIYYNPYVLNNLKIIEKTPKTIFLIDPEEEGLRYLKSTFKVRGIQTLTKIDYRNRSFKKVLEKSIIEGGLIFIQISGDQLPFIISQIINPILKKNQSNGNLQICLQDKILPYNNKFKAYLFCTNQREEYSIELISKVTTVNFSITLQQMQEKLTHLIVSVQFPEQNQQLQQLNKTNIKDNIQLKSIQTKILNIFSEMSNPEDILKTEEILQVLSTSNRLYQQINQRIEESKLKAKQILVKRDNYRAKGSKSAKLYFQIKLLKQLSPYYQYSFSWFIQLFQMNIHAFPQAITQQIMKSMPQQLKPIAPLVIALYQFHRVRFQSLFNNDVQKQKFVLERYQKLKVSPVRLSKIVSNLKKSKIQNLELMVMNHPQKFSPMLSTPGDIIMSAIPDEYSSLEFFDKLVIINCFRPDCTIQLLNQWFRINFETAFNTPFAKLLQNTKSYVPIMIQQDSEALTSSIDFINELYDLLFKENKKSVCSINANNSSLQRAKLEIQSAFTNDQWIVVQGLGENHEELTSFILELFEQSDFKRKQMFRFWIVLNKFEIKIVSQKLIKLSLKIIFEEQDDLIKKIGNVYMLQQQALLKYGDSRQSNKKKYLLNELVTFHYMVNQKYKFKKKLWNQPQYFEETDLSLNSKYLYLTQPDQMKKLYPNIVTNIIYGGKITDQQDVETIALHIEEAMKNTNLDRNYFWQSVWADDKFPKNQLQYEHYLKSVIQKSSSSFKNIYEIYGITPFVNNHLAQVQYKKISQFYNSTKMNRQLKDIVSTIKIKSHQLLAIISTRPKRSQTLYIKNEGNHFRYYLTEEYEYYSIKAQQIQNYLKQYSEVEDIFNQTDKQWSTSILNNKVPKSWNVSTMLSLNQWLTQLIEAHAYILKLIQDSGNQQKQGIQIQRVRIYNLEFTHYFSQFCDTIFSMNNCNHKTHSLLWQSQKQGVIVDNIGVQVQSWYLWNAIFDKAVAPLKEDMIEEYYYCKLPIGVLTVIEKSQLSKISNYEQISVYNHSFEYGQNSVQIRRIYMPVKKTADNRWIKRMRVHLTLNI